MRVDHAKRSDTRPATWRPVAWRPLIAVLAVIAFLTGGWLLISAPLSDTEPVAAGRTLSLGSGDKPGSRDIVGSGERTATVTVAPDGWQLHKAATNLGQTYNLSKAGVELTMSYVTMPATGDADDIWSGLGKLTEVNGGTLGAPQATSTSAGQPGQSGPLHQGGKIGTAYAFPSPDGRVAVEFTVLGPAAPQAAQVGQVEQARQQAEQIARSVTFAADQS